jgi:hypothetical protein
MDLQTRPASKPFEQLDGSGLCSTRSTAIASAIIASMLARGFDLSIRHPRPGVSGDRVGRVARPLAVIGKGEPPLNDDRVKTRRRRNHPRIVLRERNHEHAFVSEFFRGLVEPPEVVAKLANAEPAGESLDVVDGFEHAAVAVVRSPRRRPAPR